MWQSVGGVCYNCHAGKSDSSVTHSKRLYTNMCTAVYTCIKMSSEMYNSKLLSQLQTTSMIAI